MPVVADVYSHLVDGEHPEPEEELEIEDDDDISEVARGLFGIDLGGECESVNESVSFCENGDENDGILFKTGENEEVVQTLVKIW